MVPCKYRSADGFRLGMWVNKQRTAKSQGKLSKEQVDRLNKLGFVWDAYRHAWEQGFDKLQDYQAEHDDLIVPCKYRSADGFCLGPWVNTQRTAKSRGKLSKEQVGRLNKLDFVWDAYRHAWEQGFDKLQDYQDLIVPCKYRSADGFCLGPWVNTQRTAKSRGKLSKEQVGRLNKLDFVWDAYRHAWEHGVDRLQAYQVEHGDLMVPWSYSSADGFRLGMWVNKQRTAKSQGKLSKEQVDRLNKLGFVWDARRNGRENAVDRLQAYQAEHGDLMVPWSYSSADGFRLGMWVNKQRTAKSQGKLSRSRLTD